MHRDLKKKDDLIFILCKKAMDIIIHANLSIEIMISTLQIGIEALQGKPIMILNLCKNIIKTFISFASEKQNYSNYFPTYFFKNSKKCFKRQTKY